VHRRALVVLGFASLALPLALVRSAAAQIVIDSFETAQSALTLTYPPAGTSASSSDSGSGILGGERDVQINLSGGVIAGNTETAVVSSGFFSYSQDATIAGTSVIQWDGADGSPTLNPTGLGGQDLTAAGTQDALLLNVFFDDLPIQITFQVWTDAGNASAATFTTPGLLFSSTNFAIPYSSFTPTLGAGADFTRVGAIVMTVGSSTSAPDLVIDSLSTTALVSATTTITDSNGHSRAQAGDTLLVTTVISNPSDGIGAAANDVVVINPAPANTSLVAGSVTTTQGTVTMGSSVGDTSAGILITSLADGASATMTFQVTVNTPLPAGVTQITNAGTLDSADLFGVPFGASYPTVAGTALTIAGSSTVTVGGNIGAQATLTDGSSPTGTITFHLYAPDDFACATAIASSTATVSGNGPYSATPVAAAAAGTYQWTASYGGDADNQASATACGDVGGRVVVSRANVTFSAVPTPTAGFVGGPLADQAVLGGGFSPTGTLTFTLFAPGDTRCATAIASSVVTVHGGGTYTSQPVTVTQPGTYRWDATYSGDGNNTTALTGCNDAAQLVTVDPAIAAVPTLSQLGLAALALLLAALGLSRVRRRSPAVARRRR
jgi:uncharacterized repeat protein (TIGR01451 family)